MTDEDKTALSWLAEVAPDASPQSWKTEDPDQLRLLHQAVEWIDSQQALGLSADEVAKAALQVRGDTEQLVVSAALRMLVNWHDRLDVVLAAAAINLWRTVHLLEPVAQGLTLSTDEAARLTDMVVREAAGDLAAGIALNVIALWAKSNPTLAFQTVVNHPELPVAGATELMVAALRTGLPETDLAEVQAWSESENPAYPVFLGMLPELVRTGVWSQAQALESIEFDLFGDSPNADLAFYALRRLVEQSLFPEGVSLLERLARDSRPSQRMVLARYLSGTRHESLRALGRPLLLNALDTESEHTGVIQALDELLAQLSDSEPTLVEEVLTGWLEHHSKEPAREIFRQRFQHTYHQVHYHHPALWGELAGRWLLDRPQLAAVARTLLQDHPTDFAHLEPVTDEQYVRLTQRVLSVEGGGPVQLTLLASLERMATTPVRITALQAAAQEIVVDYPGSSQTFEETQATKAPLLVAALKEKREAYFVPRQGRKALLEWQSPSDRYRKWQTFARRSERETYDRIEAEGDFVFTKLLTKVAAARGDAWSVVRHDGTPSEVTSFTTFSHEIELPRTEILDPEGSFLRRQERNRQPASEEEE